MTSGLEAVLDRDAAVGDKASQKMFVFLVIHQFSLNF